MAISQALTLEEFLSLPEEKPALELIDGVVTQKVSPKLRHSSLQTDIVERFNAFGRRRAFARAFPELRITFAGSSVVPDVSVYAWERIPSDEAGDLVQDATTPPDVAVEIRSPGQSLRSQIERCLWYVGHEVRVAVLVDPEERSVEVFRPDTRTGALRGDERIDLDDILPGFELTVAGLFEALKAR